MYKKSVILLMLVCTVASAQVYKRTGPDGQVYFSDLPDADSEKVDVTPAQTISMPPMSENKGVQSQQEQEPAAVYTAFSIVSPTDGQEIRANDGNVSVQLSLQPALKSSHSVSLIINGEDGSRSSTGHGLNIGLSNLSRGRHTVEAAVVDTQGRQLIKAGPVSFNVLRYALIKQPR
jgi:hypothetical protein